MRRYNVELSDRFKREFRRLDKYTQKIIRAWIDKNLVDCENPRAHGKGLTANRSGQWRSRIGDYRLICSIEDEKLVILARPLGTEVKYTGINAGFGIRKNAEINRSPAGSLIVSDEVTRWASKLQFLS